MKGGSRGTATMTRGTRRSSRPKAFNLNRMNSQQLDALLFESDEENGQDDVKSEENHRKLQAESEKRKRETLNELNENIANSRNIYEDSPGTQTEVQAVDEQQIPVGETVPTITISAAPPNSSTDISGPQVIPENVQISATSDSEAIGANTKATQTEEVTVYCGCSKCRALFGGLLKVMKDTISGFDVHLASASTNLWPPQMPDPNNLHVSLGPVGSTVPTPAITGLAAPTEGPAEEIVPLVLGCKLTLPLAKKSNIELDAPDKDPQKILDALMDIFFTRDQMAGMTATGKFDANSRLPAEYADPFKAYIKKKYDKDNFNFTSKLFTKWVNCKCYNERKAVWAQDPSKKIEREENRKKMKEAKEKIRQEAEEKLKALRGVPGGEGVVQAAKPKVKSPTSRKKYTAKQVSKYKNKEDSHTHKKHAKDHSVERNRGGKSLQSLSGNKNKKRKNEGDDERENAKEDPRHTIGNKRPKASLISEYSKLFPSPPLSKGEGSTSSGKYNQRSYTLTETPKRRNENSDSTTRSKSSCHKMATQGLSKESEKISRRSSSPFTAELDYLFNDSNKAGPSHKHKSARHKYHESESRRKRQWKSRSPISKENDELEDSNDDGSADAERSDSEPITLTDSEYDGEESDQRD